MNEYPHTVTFQSFEPVPDGGGGHTEEWSDFLTTEAFVCPVKAFEQFQSQQTTNPINHNIFYPYQSGAKSDMRAVWHDRQEEKVVNGVKTMVNLILTVKSKPLDQGGQGEVLMVKCSL
jgi:SPP1 family predicted phage head-tail adaptor